MSKLNIFVIRAVLGIVFAVVLSRVFHPEFNPLVIAGLGILLVGLAYGLEYFRNRVKTGEDK